MKLDISIWNLGVPLALLAACGPRVPVDDTTGPDHTTVDAPPPGDGYDYYDDDGYDDYGDDCSHECCDGECPIPPEPYECYQYTDCPPGYMCEAYACTPALPPPPACVAQPTVAEIPLLETDGEGLALAFIEASASPGRELLVATATTIELVASDGTSGTVATMLASQLEAADLDGDGDEDIAALVFGFDSITLHTLIADGVGGWTEGPSTPIQSVFGLGDLDADGIVDVVSSGLDRVTWRRGAGDGSFLDEVTISEGFNNGALVVPASGTSSNADVIIAGNSALSYASGASGLVPQPLQPEVVTNVLGIASGDFDGDGQIDVSAIVPGSPQSIHTWRGIASSSAALTPWPLELGASFARAGDLDGDGLDDLVLASLEGELAMRHGTATGAGDPLDCLARATLPSGWIFQLALGDFDGDGRADPIVGTNGGATLVRLQ